MTHSNLQTKGWLTRFVSLIAVFLVANLVSVVADSQVATAQSLPADAGTYGQTTAAADVLARAAQPQWRAEYYSGTKLKGTPLLVRGDANIDFDWGSGAPASGLPADDFSVRWTGKFDFLRGTYRFCATADDGVRVEIDDESPFIRQWHDGVGTYCGEMWIAGGTHKIRVEYFEHTGQAKIQFWWEQTTWRGEYFDNSKLEGDPARVRFDNKIDFDWGDGRPIKGLPANKFSVRWTRRLYFEAGTYRFCVTANDGVRVEMDDKTPFIRQWHEGGGTYCKDVQMTKGLHKVRVEYFDRRGDAEIHFSRDKIG